MSAVLSERESQNNNVYGFLSSLINFSHILVSELEKFAEETLPQLTEITKKWIRVGTSFLHLITDMSVLVLDIIRESIAGVLLSCAKILASTGKFISAMDLLMNETDRADLPYKWARIIHEVLSGAKLFSDVIASGNQSTILMSGITTTRESGRREPLPIVSSISYFASHSSQQNEPHDSRIKERRSPSATSGYGE